MYSGVCKSDRREQNPAYMHFLVSDKLESKYGQLHEATVSITSLLRWLHLGPWTKISPFSPKVRLSHKQENKVRYNSFLVVLCFKKHVLLIVCEFETHIHVLIKFTPMTSLIYLLPCLLPPSPQQASTSWTSVFFFSQFF